MMRYIPINEFITPDARAIVESRSRRPPSRALNRIRSRIENIVVQGCPFAASP
jgi:hypothetical protein